MYNWSVKKIKIKNLKVVNSTYRYEHSNYGRMNTVKNYLPMMWISFWEWVIYSAVHNKTEISAKLLNWEKLPFNLYRYCIFQYICYVLPKIGLTQFWQFCRYCSLAMHGSIIYCCYLPSNRDIIFISDCDKPKKIAGANQ